MAAPPFPQDIEQFFSEPNLLMLATVMRDGSPQVTPVWFLWEDGHFLINTAGGRTKIRNMERDPRVAFAIVDRNNLYRYVQVRGRVIRISRETGHDDIDRLSLRYTGNATYRGDPERKTDRVSLSIEPESYSAMGFR